MNPERGRRSSSDSFAVRGKRYSDASAILSRPNNDATAQRLDGSETSEIARLLAIALSIVLTFLVRRQNERERKNVPAMAPVRRI
jgi:hypothetical protein